jgi:hypothetical protein
VGSTVPGVDADGAAEGEGLCRRPGVVAKPRDAIVARAVSGAGARLDNNAPLGLGETHCCTARAALAGLYIFIVQLARLAWQLRSFDNPTYPDVTNVKLLALGPRPNPRQSSQPFDSRNIDITTRDLRMS